MHLKRKSAWSPCGLQHQPHSARRRKTSQSFAHQRSAWPKTKSLNFEWSIVLFLTENLLKIMKFDAVLEVLSTFFKKIFSEIFLQPFRRSWHGHHRGALESKRPSSRWEGDLIQNQDFSWGEICIEN